MSNVSYILFFCFLLGACQKTSSEKFETTTLTIGSRQVIAEVAESEAQQRQGLMSRTNLPANHGMLFIFSKAEKHCMWMKNTVLPLSVAFLDAQGKVAHIAAMQPETERHHCSPVPVKYALEMASGWFAMQGVAIGSEVVGLTR